VTRDPPNIERKYCDNLITNSESTPAVPALDDSTTTNAAESAVDIHRVSLPSYLLVIYLLYTKVSATLILQEGLPIIRDQSSSFAPVFP
jgi:hypothetical protein